MKADLLALLTAKSMNYQISSGNHDAITSEDIAHFLGTRDLDSREYDFLMAKYTEDNHARSMLFDDIYEDVFDIFTKHIDISKIKTDKYLLRHFINLALRETMLTVCPFCLGRGIIGTKNSIEKCYHCEGTGQFIYDDDNRPEFLDMKKEEYMNYKKPYIETLEMVKNIEINALAKIGDDS